MATIVEKARAEADAAEAENPDEEPETETPAEPETDDGDEEGEEETKQEPEQATGKRNDPKKMFDTALRAFHGKLCRIFEVDDLVPAPHPGVVGFMLPGFAEPKTHDNYKTCPTCNGLGNVLTGAVTGDVTKDTHICPDPRCKGNGFWTKATAQPEAPATGPLAVQPIQTVDGEYGEAAGWLGDPTITPGQ